MGQGSAGLGKGRHPQSVEEEALRTGISLGMTLIDTAEVYGSEEFIGRAIAGQRNRLFREPTITPYAEEISPGGLFSGGPTDVPLAGSAAGRVRPGRFSYSIPWRYLLPMTA